MARHDGEAKAVHEDCTGTPGDRWSQYLRGAGTLEFAAGTWRLVTADVSKQSYTDAQIDDYQGLSRRRFLWRPPLTMRVKARFSHGQDELKGTAGFGFWNDPFLMTGWRLPALPKALWFFFASPPSNMVVCPGVPGHGWKAMALDAHRWSFIASLPLLPLAVALMNVTALRRAVWPPIQQAARAFDAILDLDMTAWHSYEIVWTGQFASFSVDGRAVAERAPSPGGPLGFVLWLDNQFAVVTPCGRLGYGLLGIPGRQWLEVDRIVIEPCDAAL